MRFDTAKDMLNVICSGTDLYNESLGVYVFVYNDKESIAVYKISAEQAEEISMLSEINGGYWGEYLGHGGEIYDSPENISWCNDMYQYYGWIPTENYKKTDHSSLSDQNECLIKTGITRYIDDYGRIVLPKEVRRLAFGNTSEGCQIEFFYKKDGTIILKPVSN